MPKIKRISVIDSAARFVSTAFCFAHYPKQGSIASLNFSSSGHAGTCKLDEAGQVALANLAAMGTSAGNLVLLGDQVQLGQPIQGVHPGRSRNHHLNTCLTAWPPFRRSRAYFWGPPGACILMCVL